MNINGKAYGWSDVTIDLPGLNIEVDEISYDDELEKELVYGKGSRPRGYATGNYKPSGKMTVSRDEYDVLVDYCKAQGMPFYKLIIPKIVVSYANEGDRTRSDILSKVSFAKRSNKAAQGDKTLKVDIDLIIQDIKVDGLDAV